MCFLELFRVKLLKVEEIIKELKSEETNKEQKVHFPSAFFALWKFPLYKALLTQNMLHFHSLVYTCFLFD